MVTLTIDNKTYAALCRQAAARGLSVEDWLKSQSAAANRGEPPEPPFGRWRCSLLRSVWPMTSRFPN
jgi:hypothetical protein